MNADPRHAGGGVAVAVGLGVGVRVGDAVRVAVAVAVAVPTPAVAVRVGVGEPRPVVPPPASVGQSGQPGRRTTNCAVAGCPTACGLSVNVTAACPLGQGTWNSPAAPVG